LIFIVPETAAYILKPNKLVSLWISLFNNKNDVLIFVDGEAINLGIT
jgi:hypothetical protein